MSQSNIIMYTAEDGLTKIEATFDKVGNCCKICNSSNGRRAAGIQEYRVL